MIRICREYVLVVHTELLEKNLELVRKLVMVTRRATTWINEHPKESAEIMSEQLQAAGEKIFLSREAETTANLEITPGVILRSMDRIEYTMDIDPEVIQETMGYMVELGYLKEGIEAVEILDLSYLKDR